MSFGGAESPTLRRHRNTAHCILRAALRQYLRQYNRLLNKWVRVDPAFQQPAVVIRLPSNRQAIHHTKQRLFNAHPQRIPMLPWKSPNLLHRPQQQIIRLRQHHKVLRPTFSIADFSFLRMQISTRPPDGGVRQSQESQKSQKHRNRS